MTLWVQNNNSRQHRGVWHAAENATIKDVPEERKESIHKIHKYHSYSCPIYSKRYSNTYGGYWNPETRRYEMPEPVCTCALKTQEDSVLLGECVSIYVTPAHQEVRATILCHQTDIHSSGLTYTYKKTGKEVDGGTVIHTQRIERDSVYESENEPPGAVCSRCVAKVDAER